MFNLPTKLNSSRGRWRKKIKVDLLGVLKNDLICLSDIQYTSFIAKFTHHQLHPGKLTYRWKSLVGSDVFSIEILLSTGDGFLGFLGV